MTMTTSEPPRRIRVEERTLQQLSGTWGLKNASYAQIGKAIQMLGGSLLRTSRNSHLMYELSDKKITLVHPAKVGQLIGRSTLSDYIKLIGEAADAEPAIVVATLGAAGAAWIRQSPDLRELERLVKQNQNLLVHEKGRRVLIKTAEENLNRREIKRVNKEEEGAAPEAVDNSLSYGLTDAIRLAGDIGDHDLNRYLVRISAHARDNRGFGGELVEKGWAKRVPHPVQKNRATWRLTEEGALAVGHYVEAELRKEGSMPEPAREEPVPTPAKEEPVREEPVAEAVPAPAPKPKQPEPEWQGLGMAIIKLCQHHKVYPVMHELTIDVPATILRLAEETE